MLFEFPFSLDFFSPILEKYSFNHWPFHKWSQCLRRQLPGLYPYRQRDLCILSGKVDIEWLRHAWVKQDLGLVWGVHVVIQAAWTKRALQHFVCLRGHTLHCFQGGSRAWGLPGGRSSVTGQPAQLHANLACSPCFSVTVDPNMLRSDVFIDFLKLVQLVSLLFFTKVIISRQNMSLP